MELAQQQLLPVPQAIAWDALNDIALLQTCIPGCESLTADGPDAYVFALTAAVGPVRAKFKGRLRIDNKVPPTSYQLEFEGQGGPAGYGKGHAEVRLEPTGPASTTLHYVAHATVGGKLAQIGSRLVDMAAQKVAADFFSRFTEALVERHPMPPRTDGDAPPPVADTSPWHRFVAWLRQTLWRR